MARSANEAVPNTTLYNLRDARGLTQQELAEDLAKLARDRHGKSISVDNVTVSRWERGVIERPSPIYRRLLAEYFGVSLEELGLTRPAPQAVAHGSIDIEAFVVDHSPRAVEPRVEEDQRQWGEVRRRLNRHRPALAHVASRLYNDESLNDDTGLLVRPAWLSSSPLPIDEVELRFYEDSPTPLVNGGEAQARAVRPLATTANRFHRYSHALRDLDHPGLFENRLSYRLLNVERRGDHPVLSFGHTTYFESVDVNEALAHEFAASHLGRDDAAPIHRPSWRQLPLRRLIDDPFDLARRPALPSIDTLTVRNDPNRPTFVLHDRSAARVAVAGGTLHVMPAGVFQPSSILPRAQVEDFDLWRNVMREYSEEFLGNAEHDGAGAPLLYDSPPFSAMEAARSDGTLRVYYLGIALDALTLYPEILTVVVIEPDVYDELFADMVHTNAEGTVVTIGGARTPTYAIPFDHLTVPRLLEHDALAPAAAGCLKLAWAHRDSLLTG